MRISAFPRDALRSCARCSLSFILVVTPIANFAADLSRWFQTYPNPTSQNLWDAACDGTNWVVVGNAGTILVSPGATNWSPAISGVAATRALKGIAYGATNVDTNLRGIEKDEKKS